MAVFETWLKSDLKKPVTVKQLPGVVFSQDSKANKIGVIVTDGGEPVTLSGTVYGYVIKPNGTTVEVAGAIDSEDASRASFVMPQEAYAVGHISIVIKLSSTGSVVTTLAACTAYVYQSRKGTGVVPTGTVIPDLQDLETAIADANTAAAAATAAAATVANLINDSTTAADHVWSSQKVSTELAGKQATLTFDNTPTENSSNPVKSGGVYAQEKALKEGKADVIDNTAAGMFAEFADGAAGLPMAIEIDIVPSQAGTGNPTPSNVRAIVGRNSCRIGVSRKNLLGGMALANAIVSSMPSSTIDTTNKCVSFAANASVQHVINGYGTDGPLVYGFKFKENTQYTFILTYDKGAGSLTGSNVKVAYTDGTTANTPTISDPSTKETIVFVSAAGKTIRAFYKSNNSGTTNLYYDESGIFEGVLTAEDFEAFDGAEYNVTFPEAAGTVYGGKLKIKKDGTGTLTVDHESKEILEVDASQSSTGYQLCPIGPLGYVAQGYGYCNMLKRITGSASTIGYGECLIYNSEGYNRAQVALRISSDLNGEGAAGTRENYNAYLQELKNNGTPLVVVYKLATPTVYELTAAQVLSLFGLNIVYADAGEVSVTYEADTKKYIAERKKDTEALLADAEEQTATGNHSKGDVFICGGNLYEATASIATGDTIAVGTNVKTINLAEYIAEQVSALMTADTLIEGKAKAMAMTEIDQMVFQNNTQGIEVAIGRTADVAYNTIRSAGDPDSTYGNDDSVVITKQGGAAAADSVIDTSANIYKSYFQAIPAPVNGPISYGLCVDAECYVKKNGESTYAPLIYLFTYDSSGNVKRVSLDIPAGDEAYALARFALPSAFLTNKNIAVIAVYRRGKMTMNCRLRLSIRPTTNYGPTEYKSLTATDMSNTVIDDLTT